MPRGAPAANRAIPQTSEKQPVSYRSTVRLVVRTLGWIVLVYSVPRVLIAWPRWDVLIREQRLAAGVLAPSQSSGAYAELFESRSVPCSGCTCCAVAAG